MPLSAKDLGHIRDQIKEAKKAIKDARADLATAKRAGIDVSEQEAILRDLEARVRKMEIVYG